MANYDLAEQVLLQEGVTLRPSYLKTIGMTLVCLIFVAGGLLMIANGKMLLGSIAASFFGLGVLVGATGLIKPLSTLRITKDYLQVVNWRRVDEYAWADIEHFGVASIRGSKFVGMNFVEGHRLASGRMADLNTSICGFHAALSDTYGMKANQLAELLNQVRDRLEGSPSKF